MIIMAVGFLIVFFCSNTYAFSNKAETLGFASLENDSIIYTPRNIFKKRISLMNNSDDIFNRQAEENFRQDEEVFTYTRATSNRNRYLRTAIDTAVVLGLTSLYYWGTQTFSSDFDYDVSFETLRKKFSGEAIRFDDLSIRPIRFRFPEFQAAHRERPPIPAVAGCPPVTLTRA